MKLCPHCGSEDFFPIMDPVTGKVADYMCYICREHFSEPLILEEEEEEEPDAP